MTTWEKVKGDGVMKMTGAILQALVIAALLWVGNKTADSAEKIAGLTSQVQALEKQVARIQNSEDRRLEHDAHGISERR